MKTLLDDSINLNFVERTVCEFRDPFVLFPFSTRGNKRKKKKKKIKD